MFVQSSTRGAELFSELARTKWSAGGFKVDYMMTFGRGVGAEYAKYVHGTVVPIGSPINNLISKHKIKRTGTIAFISQYRDIEGLVCGGKYRTRHEFFEQIDLLVLTFLIEYAKNKGKKFFIVPSLSAANDPALGKREQAYYNELLKQTCTFAEWHWRGSSYEAVDSAEVVVGIDSTLGYESAARRNKTAIFAIRSQMLDVPDRTYGWPESRPDDGPFWTNRPDPAAFERILDHLFAINDEQWQSELSEHGFSDVVAYDPGNTILQATFQSELGPRPGRLCAPGSTSRRAEAYMQGSGATSSMPPMMHGKSRSSRSFLATTTSCRKSSASLPRLLRFGRMR